MIVSMKFIKTGNNFYNITMIHSLKVVKKDGGFYHLDLLFAETMFPTTVSKTEHTSICLRFSSDDLSMRFVSELNHFLESEDTHVFDAPVVAYNLVNGRL